MWGIMPEQASSFAADIDSVIKVVTYAVGFWLIASKITTLTLLV